MAIFHLRARTVTRASGASAAAAAAYILRLGRFAKADSDPCVFSRSGNMPTWAAGPGKRLEYWRAADLQERSNGRLTKTVELALPLELNHAQRVALVLDFCERVARTNSGEPLPYLAAIHAGKLSNPHAHVMVSERVADGHDRTPELWFSRASPKGKNPAQGGARKTEDLKPKAWLLAKRELLARLTNDALAAAGFAAHVDHRSLREQGIDRPPGVHLGPVGAARLRRGKHSRRAHDLELHQSAGREAQQLMHELRREARAVELELASLITSPAAAPINTAGVLARAQRQAEAAKNSPPQRSKSNDSELRP
ncbi:MobA/MobL family protein [Acidovorax sp. 22279]|uniref:MobA/MobL family protein n=1 Tax=Acidovorax sp. 22279 TaxID=3453900 RepID=UPI003F8698BE